MIIKALEPGKNTTIYISYTLCLFLKDCPQFADCTSELLYRTSL